MHTFVSYVMIISVLLTVATVEILAKTLLFLLGLPFYFLCILFAPIVARWSCPRWFDKLADWVLSRKLIWARKAGRAYRNALL